jgi:hypothetical protein
VDQMNDGLGSCACGQHDALFGDLDAGLRDLRAEEQRLRRSLMGGGGAESGAWWRDLQVERRPARTRRFDLWQRESREWRRQDPGDERTGRMTPPGRYTELHQAMDVAQEPRDILGRPLLMTPWMSDTPAEVLDHWVVGHLVRGRVLITGLGLGLITEWALGSPCVRHVDVVEIEREVVDLIAPYFLDDIAAGRLTIHHADALTYQFPRSSRWDVVWHDISQNIDPDNLPAMRKLRRRYENRCAWQGSSALHRPTATPRRRTRSSRRSLSPRLLGPSCIRQAILPMCSQMTRGASAHDERDRLAPSR